MDTVKRTCRCGIVFDDPGGKEFCSNTCAKRKVWISDKEITSHVMKSSIKETAELFKVSSYQISNRYQKYREALGGRNSVKYQIETGGDPRLIGLTELSISRIVQAKLTKAEIRTVADIAKDGAMDRLKSLNIGNVAIREIIDAFDDINVPVG